MLVKYKEIFKLKVMLDNADIPYEFFDRSWVLINKIEYASYQIIVYKPNSEDIISVVEGFGTYGEKKDLLEIMECLTEKEEQEDSVLGYLNADEVFERIKKSYFVEKAED